MRKSVLLGIVLLCLVGISGNAWAESSTKLFLSFDGDDGDTFTTDYSGSAHTITFQGDAQLDTAEKKFGTASLLLDGDGDYISISDSDDWDFGSGDFTIDFWVRFNTVDHARLIAHGGSGMVAGKDGWTIYYEAGATNRLSFEYRWSGTNIYVLRSWAPSTNTWYHVAVVRTGTKLKMFVDGVQLGGDVIDDPVTDMTERATSLDIGSLNDQNDNELDGWIDEIRISKGIARWTNDFTPPTSADALTKLFLSFDGNDGDTFTTDYSGSAHTINFNGNAQLDTAEKKFETASALLDGNGDYLSVSDSDDWTFGTEDFTIDFWVMFNTLQDAPFINQIAGASDKWAFQWSESAHKLFYYNLVATKYVSWTPSTDTWYHIALVRSGNKLYFFVDGEKLEGDPYVTGADYSDIAGPLRIGGDGAWVGSYLDGRLDEVRISKGIARWTPTTTTTSTTTTTTTTTTVPPTTTTTIIPTTTTIPPTQTPAPTTTPPPVSVKGSIIITSEPTSADVLFDGAPKGKTPLTVKDLPIGVEHKIKVSKPDCYPAERIASATTGGTQVYVKLNCRGDDKPHITVSQTSLVTRMKVGEETMLEYGVLNDGDADAYNVKITMEVGSGLSTSFISGANKAGGLAYWTGDVVKESAVESAQLRVKCQESGTKYVPLNINYKDAGGKKYIDSTTLTISCDESSEPIGSEGDSDGDGWSDERERKVGTDPFKSDTDGDGYLDPQDPAPLDPTKPESGSPLKGICGPTAILAFAMLPAFVWAFFRRKGGM